MQGRRPPQTPPPRVPAHKQAQAGVVVAGAEVEEVGCAVKLLAGEGVNGTTASGLGQHIAVWFVSGGGFQRAARHLLAHAAQAVSEQGAGLRPVVLQEQVEAVQVGGLSSAIVGNGYLGEVYVVIYKDSGDALFSL